MSTRLVTFRPASEALLNGWCTIHKVPRGGLGIPVMGPKQPEILGPSRFVACFFDSDGEAVCDKCVTAGLIEGSVTIENPSELMRSDLAEVKEAFGRWGELPLETLERALQAADYRGRLPEFAARLITASNLEPPASDIKAGIEGQAGALRRPTAVADDPAGIGAPAPDVRHTALTKPRRGGRRGR